MPVTPEVRMLHHLAHGRVAFTEAWLAEQLDVDMEQAAQLCAKVHMRQWISGVAYGGVAGRGPEGRGRTWVGRLATR